LKNKTATPDKSKPGALNEFTYLQYTIVFEFDWFDRKPIMESPLPNGGGFEVDRFDQIDKFINATLNPGGAFKVEQVFKFAPGNGDTCDVVESEGDDSWDCTAEDDEGNIRCARVYTLRPPRGYAFAQLKNPGYAVPYTALPRTDAELTGQFQLVTSDETIALCGLTRTGYLPIMLYNGPAPPPPVGLAKGTCFKIIPPPDRGVNTTERKLNAYDVLTDYRISPPG
jgi:hypothetical protein